MPNQALFYPWIDINDDKWLKTSLLYWDELRTIVPSSIDTPYKTNSTQALHDSGILQPIRVSPEMYEIESLSDSILKYLTTNEGARLIASNGHHSSMIHTGKLPNKFEQFSHIHPEKLPYMVQDQLRDLFGRSNRDGDWLRVDSGFADFYMTLLASKLSERTGASLVTNNVIANDLAVVTHLDAALGKDVSDAMDNHRHHREYLRFNPRENRPSVLAEGLLASLAISKISIWEETSIQDILDFKREHSDELGQFHMKLNELCGGLNEDISVEAMHEKVSTIYRNGVEPSINNLKSALDGKKIKWRMDGLMKLSVLSAGTYPFLALAGVTAPYALLAGAGISLTAMAVLHNIDKDDGIRNSPFAYLLSAEREFS